MYVYCYRALLVTGCSCIYAYNLAIVEKIAGVNGPLHRVIKLYCKLIVIEHFKCTVARKCKTFPDPVNKLNVNYIERINQKI